MLRIVLLADRWEEGRLEVGRRLTRLLVLAASSLILSSNVVLVALERSSGWA